MSYLSYLKIARNGHFNKKNFFFQNEKNDKFYVKSYLEEIKNASLENRFLIFNCILKKSPNRAIYKIARFVIMSSSSYFENSPNGTYAPNELFQNSSFGKFLKK